MFRAFHCVTSCRVDLKAAEGETSSLNHKSSNAIPNTLRANKNVDSQLHPSGRKLPKNIVTCISSCIQLHPLIC